MPFGSYSFHRPNQGIIPMSEPMSRRDALMAATALGAVAGVAQAEGSGDDGVMRGPPGSRRLKLQITLPDGQIVTFNASKAVVTFEDGGALVATPSGVLPLTIAAAGEKPPSKDPSPARVAPGGTGPGTGPSVPNS